MLCRRFHFSQFICFGSVPKLFHPPTTLLSNTKIHLPLLRATSSSPPQQTSSSSSTNSNPIASFRRKPFRNASGQQSNSGGSQSGNNSNPGRWKIGWKALVCNIGGAAFFIQGMISAHKGYDTYSWTRTTGEVVESKVTPEEPHPILLARLLRGTCNVTYTYTVDNVRYKSSRIHYGEVDEEQALMYPKLALVRLHFDPHHPESAVLQPGIPFSSLCSLGMSGVLFLHYFIPIQAIAGLLILVNARVMTGPEFVI